MISSNITELSAHLKSIYGNMFLTKEFENKAIEAGDIMQEKVIDNMQGANFNYIQSRQLENVISTQTAGLKFGKTRAKIGFGELNDLNQQTKRRAQRGTFPNGKEIRLRPEKDLPSWIIMEFGRKGDSTGARPKVPSFISNTINYTPREKKPYLYGPSLSTHWAKPIFFQTNKEMLEKHHGIANKKANTFNRHPGIREGRFFRNALRDSIPKVNLILAEGIRDSIKSLSRKNGGSGEVSMS